MQSTSSADASSSSNPGGRRQLKWRSDGWRGACPSARSGHAAASVAHTPWVYMFGGMANGGGLSNELCKYDTEAMVCTWPPQRGAVPAARWGHALIAVGRKLVLWGGISDQMPNGVLVMYDIETAEWTNVAASGLQEGIRYHHQGVCLEGRLAVSVGGCGAGGGPTMDIRCFDPELLKVYDPVHKDSPVPPARQGCSAVVLHSNIVVLGGYTGKGICSDMWVANTSQDAAGWMWSEVSTQGVAPPCITGASAAGWHDRALIFGGMSSGSFSNQVYVLSASEGDQESKEGAPGKPAFTIEVAYSAGEIPTERSLCTLAATRTNQTAILLGGERGSREKMSMSALWTTIGDLSFAPEPQPEAEAQESVVEEEDDLMSEMDAESQASFSARNITSRHSHSRASVASNRSRRSAASRATKASGKSGK